MSDGTALQPASLAAMWIYTSPWEWWQWHGDSPKDKLKCEVTCCCCLVHSIAGGVFLFL